MEICTKFTVIRSFYSKWKRSLSIYFQWKWTSDTCLKFDTESIDVFTDLLFLWCEFPIDFTSLIWLLHFSRLGMNIYKPKPYGRTSMFCYSEMPFFVSSIILFPILSFHSFWFGYCCSVTITVLVINRGNKNANSMSI